MKRNITISILILVFILVTNIGVAKAQIGARPLGMGEAFIAVADDVNAVYWNPAGLVQLEKEELTYYRRLNNRDNSSPDHFVAAARYNTGSGMAYGYGYINVKDKLAVGTNGEVLDQDESTYIFSMATKFGGGFSIGTNIKYIDNKVKSNPEKLYRDKYVSIDVSALYQVSNYLSLGLLVQDVNEPEFDTYQKDKVIRNIIPGIALKLGESFILSTSLNDAANTSNTEIEERVRVGLEQKITDYLALRAGKYGEKITYGLGVNLGDYFLVDYVFVDNKLEENHQVGVSIRY